MNFSDSGTDRDWRFIHFGLIVTDRYRRVLDTILSSSQSRRASVHFLVNMLEAYFFAHSDAVNSVLGTNLDDTMANLQ